MTEIKYVPVEVQSCMNLSYEDIAKLSEEDCAAKAYIVAKYAAFIGQEYNRQNVRIKWAKHNLNMTLGREGDKYGDKFTKYDMKLAMMCNDNVQAKVLNDIVLYAEARATELEGMASHISLISRSLDSVKQSKRKFYKAE